jgi:hypothetical protein
MTYNAPKTSAPRDVAAYARELEAAGYEVTIVELPSYGWAVCHEWDENYRVERVVKVFPYARNTVVINEHTEEAV